ncbi:MAG: OmpA family protein [Candidatus Omnitrophota bacterium]
MKSKLVSVFFVVFLSISLAGCTIIFQRGRRSDVEKIAELSQQVDELTQAQRLLEDRLSQEIRDKQVRLERMEKGLVITFVADVLFDSGKAELKPESFNSLKKVARVLKENVPELRVGVEGHTDNQPIKFSGWKSNWELSSSRGLSVLHYLTDQAGVKSERLSAIAYGEFYPVASNDTQENRQLNRRVEVVIVPQVTKVKKAAAKPAPVVEVPEEKLK